jgi:hypothetical protein
MRNKYNIVHIILYSNILFLKTDIMYVMTYEDYYSRFFQKYDNSFPITGLNTRYPRL